MTVKICPRNSHQSSWRHLKPLPFPARPLSLLEAFKLCIKIMYQTASTRVECKCFLSLAPMNDPHPSRTGRTYRKQRHFSTTQVSLNSSKAHTRARACADVFYLLSPMKPSRTKLWPRIEDPVPVATVVAAAANGVWPGAGDGARAWRMETHLKMVSSSSSSTQLALLRFSHTHTHTRYNHIMYPGTMHAHAFAVVRRRGRFDH